MSTENDIDYAVYISKVIVNKLYISDIPEFKKQKCARYEAVLKAFSTSMNNEFEGILAACGLLLNEDNS